MFRPITLVCAAVIAAAPLAAQAAPVYTVAVVPTVPGTVNIVTRAMNNRGDAVGYSQTVNGARWHAASYYNGIAGNPYDRAAETSVANDVNDAGRIVGSITNQLGYTHAAIWDWGTLMPTLITSGPYSYSEATGVNAAGQVVGSMNTEERSSLHAFLYDGNQTIDLGTLGGAASAAFDINDSGVVAGSSRLGNGAQHAFIYMNGQMIDIGTLGGDSSAAAINNNGVVTGSFSVSPNASHAFVYADGEMIDIGTLGGGNTTASDINNAGQVVGLSAVGGNDRAFLYDGGEMFDLNSLIDASLGWTLTSAVDINDRGQILATGCRAGGSCASVVLSLADGGQSDVPEPEAFTAGLAGLALFGWMRRRKQA